MFLIFAFNLQLSNAQQNTTTTTSNLTTDFTKFFADSKDFQTCVTPTLCMNPIDVLYQDNSTIALKSSYVDMIWKAVSLVKKDGYKIDDITSYATGGGSSINPDLSINILVVMSR